VTAKIPSPLSPYEARAVVSQCCVWRVELNTHASVIHASDIQERNANQRAEAQAERLDPIKLSSFSNSHRASYSRKPVGFTSGSDS
jgi:hypothetical protein